MNMHQANDRAPLRASLPLIHWYGQRLRHLTAERVRRAGPAGADQVAMVKLQTELRALPADARGVVLAAVRCNQLHGANVVQLTASAYGAEIGVDLDGNHHLIPKQSR